MFDNIINNIDNKLKESGIKTDKQIKIEKRLKCERFLNDIETTLFPYWMDKSKVSIQTDKHYECWRELLEFLYRSKALNKQEIYNQIKYVGEINGNIRND